MEDTEIPALNTTLQHGNHPLSRKLNKILNTRLDNDKDMLEALRVVSTFFTENNIQSRRNLRGEIERRSLLINQQFCDAFSHVIKDLDGIHSDVKAMTYCCKDMSDRLSETKKQTQELITKTSKLQAKGQTLQLHSELVDAFLNKFQLKSEEKKMFLGAREDKLEPEFFEVLEKVQRIHRDVKVLLRTNQQTAGLEIMEQMALQQESAYERLYRWSQSQCRAMTSNSLDISPIQQQALKALQNRIVLFNYTLDEYASARRGAVVRGFIDALTRGKPIKPNSPTNDMFSDLNKISGGPRPIELHAHDPQRYVGDMLAWLHQTTASEKECILQLLADCEKSTAQCCHDTLSHIMEGICRPLKVRVEQVLVSELGSLALHKLTNLLKFYLNTIRDIIGEGNNKSLFLETLSDMYVLCRKLFFNSLQYLASKLLDKVELPPMDLSTPYTLSETLKLLRDIFDSHNASILGANERHADLIEVMQCTLDPLIQMCAMSASQLQPADMATFMINCMHSIKFLLSLYEFTDERIEMLSAQIDAHLDTLVNEQAASILTKGGIAVVYKLTLKHENDATPLSKLPGLEKNSLFSAFQNFDQVVLSCHELVLPQITMLASATLKEVAKARSYDLVLSAYTVVYNSFNKVENGYDPSNFSTKHPDQIKLLLC